MSVIKVYSLDQVAEILQLTRRTLYSYVRSGKLHAVKIGKHWRVTDESLQAFVTHGTPVVDANRRPENRKRLRSNAKVRKRA